MLIEAAVVVALVLFIFLLNARATFVSLTAIPISILITVLVFRAFGLTINTMTLGGLAIAIGELVDDAVVDVENILRRLRENSASAAPRAVLEVIAQASQEVRSSIVYATMIIVLVFVPLFALPGIEGRLFTPLGIAYIVSILASLLTSVTVTPVLSYYLFSGRAHSGERESVVVRSLKEANRRLLGWAFERRRLVLGTVAAAVVVAGYAAAVMPRSFLPPFNEGTLVLSLQYNPGISLAESHRLGLLAEQLLAKVPEVKSVGRRTGRAELDEHAEGVHYSEIDVDLAPSKRQKADIYADIRETLSGLPASVAIGQPISHRLDHLQSGIRAQIVLKIYGQDIEMLRRLAETSRQRLSTIPGLVDLQVEKQVLIPQVRVQIDHARAALHGLTPAAITQALDTLSNGRKVSQIVDGNRRFDVVMRLSEQDRSTTGLHNLLIPTASGFVPLSALAEIIETDGPNQIQREGTQRRIVVYGNGDGRRDLGDIAADIRRAVSELDFPQGYTHQPRGDIPGAGGGFLAHRSAVARVAGDDLYRALQPLPIDRAVAHHHGWHSAGADWQRRRLENHRATVVGGVDDRFHHACRNFGTQWDSQDFPLHQSCHSRRRAFRNGFDRSRQHGAAQSRFDDGALRWTGADSASHRRG